MQKLKEGILKNEVNARCPILGCGYSIPIYRGFFRDDHQEAINKVIKHIKRTHGIDDVFEVLERFIAQQIERDAELTNKDGSK